MRGRPTNEPKQVNIKVRVTEEMLEHIKCYSEKEDRNVSEYIRQLIRKDINAKRAQKFGEILMKYSGVDANRFVKSSVSESKKEIDGYKK